MNVPSIVKIVANTKYNEVIKSQVKKLMNNGRTLVLTVLSVPAPLVLVFIIGQL